MAVDWWRGHDFAFFYHVDWICFRSLNFVNVDELIGVSVYSESLQQELFFKLLLLYAARFGT